MNLQIPFHGTNRAERGADRAPVDHPRAPDARAGDGDGATRARIDALLAVTRRYFDAPLQPVRRRLSATGRAEATNDAR